MRALRRRIGRHTFRGTGITDYVKNAGRVEVTRRMSGHSNKTTDLCGRCVTLIA
jgi:hypothetical protein